MEKIWILVANASAATLYNFVKGKANEKPQLQVVEQLIHPESRESDRELTSDREGEYIGSQGGHGNFIENSDPHQYEAVVFAHQLYKKLDHARANREFHSLILVAAPHFMGLLHQCMDGHPFKKEIQIQEIQKDYTKEKPHDLIKLLNLHVK